MQHAEYLIVLLHGWKAALRRVASTVTAVTVAGYTGNLLYD